jgi:D-glycero-alpha-D-manno-heptose 1-phosphate guanylyltransferase
MKKDMGIMPNINAAILTGGLGTRLQTVVSDRPKALAQVGGRPFVSYLLDHLCKFQISKAVFCTGYLGEMIESYFSTSYKNLDLAYSREPFALGTAGALKLALPLLNTEQLLILNGDSYCDLDIDDFIEFHKQRNALISISVASVGDSGRYGTVRLDDRGEVIFFKEKNGMHSAGLINAGLYIIDRSVIANIPDGKKMSLELDLFPRYLGNALYGFPTDGFFIDIGIPEDYEKAQTLLPAISDN